MSALRAAAVGAGAAGLLFGLMSVPASAAGGSYTVVLHNGASGKCLEVPGGHYENGAPAQQWDCNGGSNQKWTVIPTNDGYSTLVNVSTQKCLEIADWSRNRGAAARQWDCHGGDNQKWVVSGINSDSQVSIRNKNSWMLLDDPGFSGGNGTQMIQWPEKAGAANQLWTVSYR
ncbi:RICIN domain-containing protein [Kitasatospora sp. GP82]|uniref:RICIN domain-containing protein n=1 Tax=Kitasatospora sp. GP82 TaxID=3035089 RepID=UPI00247654F0|nr:RICIN domain-containing protein [Kitasatospora sp. GP82]MDH6127057.1 hypothetical protein [Kitasatospora sp. GP82]